MHRLAVREHYDAQPTSACFVYPSPPTKPPIRLSALMLRVCDYLGNPGLANRSAAAAALANVEVFGLLHDFRSTTLWLRTG